MKGVKRIAVLLPILVACTNKNPILNHSNDERISQENSVKRQELEHLPYDFDTLLSGDYHLSFKLNLGKDLESLSLMKEDKEIRILNELSVGLPHKNLGYIGADLGDQFIFCQSYGADNPTDIQLIDKKTGKEITAGSWVDVDEKEQVILYITNIHQETEQLKLLDLKNHTERIITDFNHCRCVEEQTTGLMDCVEIKSVWKDEILLAVEYDNGGILKKYTR
jgi:hypothetical protein